ncbi:type IV secretion system protein virB10-like [Cucumis melo var. makuwa]|uniref:Type IV secretion system protein virB10-like n=2 Tax=Cucumis melo TaxID=3656 RepID=A0A1S3C1T9_CUCME|nr:uncharacterized protein LOC103495668 [Cucumis melo]KAA0031279.1 type IV secretion system protein virB10-like [Cucumis melo var. makuwa]
MSTPIDQLQPPPPLHSSHASVGPLIAVLAVISILGVIAGMIGRLCSGRPVFGYGAHYDVEDWVEKKCASCLDGSLDPPPPPPPPPPHLRHPPPLDSVPVAEPLGGPPPEIKQGADADAKGENLQSAAPGTGGES